MPSETAKTLGRLYDLPYGYPAMIGGEDEDWGEIIELKDVEEALIVLDRLEEYFGLGSPRNLYDRTVQEIQTLSGKSEQAYVYLWANPDTLIHVCDRGTGLLTTFRLLSATPPPVSHKKDL